MGHQFDPATVISALHHRVTGELLHLMDGLYANIEDGLFELAYRTADESCSRRYFDLMREMRYRKSSLVQGFARRMQNTHEQWFTPMPAYQDSDAQSALRASRMAERCIAHFSGVLQSVSERAAFGLDGEPDLASLPIGPQQIAYNFLVTMKGLRFDEPAIEIVQELFMRFVLDRIGQVYGECNLRLQDAGYLTRSELEELSRARA